jgi:hypothetical protein
VGAELFHADGRTEGQTDSHDKANSRSSQFLDRANKSGVIFYDHTVMHGCNSRVIVGSSDCIFKVRAQYICEFSAWNFLCHHPNT